MSGTAINELNNMTHDAWAIKDRMTELEAELKQLQKEKQVLMDKIKNVLKENDLPNFRNSRGLATIRRDWRCSVPKEPEKKKEFFDYLKEKGWFDEWITVHSQTLNAEYKKLYEAAAKEGEIFEIPGVGEPHIVETVTLRKK